MLSRNNTPVSAFAVYKQNKKKRRRSKNQDTLSPSPKKIQKTELKIQPVEKSYVINDLTNTKTSSVSVSTKKDTVNKNGVSRNKKKSNKKVQDVKDLKPNLLTKKQTKSPFILKNFEEITSEPNDTINYDFDFRNSMPTHNGIEQKKSKKKLLGSNKTENKIKAKKQRKSQFNVENIEDETEEMPTLVPIDTINYDSKFDFDFAEGISELNKTDPSPEGLKLFKWLIAPLKPVDFFAEYWEKQALFVERNSSSYYSDILTTERLDSIFREFPLYYTRNVDVVSYENGVKEVHNEEGRVVASALYDYYSNGCSIRVLNPHTYDQKVHILLSTLQEYFGTMVGANIYLTPPGTQGFAPHYDDIEAFVIQLEGRKHWKLYKPKGSDVLARDSSPNLKHEDIGEPFLEVTLNAGDLLYFPRGTIHEGRTDPEAHSFHITVSVYQHNCYADLLELALPVALKKAALENVNFRQGLPMNYLKHTGHVNKSKKSEIRKTIQKNVEELVDSLKEHIDVDLAADQLGRKFMYDSMPPVLSKQEVQFTSKYDGDFMKDGKILNRIEIDMDTEVRLLRYFCLRLVAEGGTATIYYNTENAKYYHGEEEQFLTIDQNLIPCVEFLQKKYPKFIKVENLPIADDIAKAQIVSDLWERGLLVTNGPLPPVSDGEEDNEESEETDSGED